MKINSFLGVLDLGFGVFIMTAMLSVSGTYSFLSNLFNWMDVSNKIALLVVLFSMSIMVYIWACASNGVYEKVRTQQIISSALLRWSVFIIFWIVLVLLSKNSYMNAYICLKGNCPESLWMYNNRWNDEKFNNTFEWNQNSIFGEKIAPAKFPTLTTLTKQPKVTSSTKSIKDKISINMIIIICNIVFYLVIFIYGWIVLYSYKTELKFKSSLCEDMQKNKMEMV